MNTVARLARTASIGALAAIALSATALAQSGPRPTTAQLDPNTAGAPQAIIRDPRALNMERLLRPISFEVEDARLENVINFIRDVTDADIEPLWVDDRMVEGLSKDELVTIKIENLPALSAIERLLRQVTDEFDAGTWQFAETGQLQIAPRSRLNRITELKIYDINDLTFQLRSVDNIPSIDLSSIGQGEGGGGGGGGGPFEEDEEDDEDRPSQAELARQLVDIIQTFVETEQWEDNGGTAGTIRYFRGALLIRAPDYMHRQIDGYRWWTDRRVAVNIRGLAFPDETPEAKARRAAEERRRLAEEERERKRQEFERRRQERERNRG
ncbi:MAG: hypothetical protein ACTS3F_01625 [Phycisphaerales bacterium]